MARSDPQEQVIRTTPPAAMRRNPNIFDDKAARRSQSALPDDAMAIIEPASNSARRAGTARNGEWRLRFQPRRRSFMDPLTGWTGSEDPLAHVSIRFPSRDAAIRFAERQGLPYESREVEVRRSTEGAKQLLHQPTVQLCCRPTGPHALCCGDYPTLKETKQC